MKKESFINKMILAGELQWKKFQKRKSENNLGFERVRTSTPQILVGRYLIMSYRALVERDAKLG